MHLQQANAAVQALIAQVGQVIHHQPQAVQLLTAAALCGGHVLIEDVPGTGKTTLAKTFAKSLQLDFQRVQFTPDLLPSDILGVSVYDPGKHSFDLHQGPIFTQILLADEINRASPRTQSALLEAMAEQQVSIERDSYPLDAFFLVIATQNPVESQGVYPLPEAQMDRFAVCFSLGYIPPEDEAALLSQQLSASPLDDLTPCLDRETLQQIRQAVKNLHVSPQIIRYIVDLTHATRNLDSVQLGASSRAAIVWLKMAQAMALIDGAEFVTPDHVQALATPVLAHRLLLNAEALYAGQSSEQIVADILAQTAIPD